MNNTLNSFTGPLYAGTPQQYLNVIYSTVADMTQVLNNNCTVNCSIDVYDPASSETADWSHFFDEEPSWYDYMSAVANVTEV